MNITIQQERLAAPPYEVTIRLTNGTERVTLSISKGEDDFGRTVYLSPPQAEALAYDLLCKAYNVRHGIHDSTPEARGMYDGKLDLDEIQCLAGLGFDEGAPE